MDGMNAVAIGLIKEHVPSITRAAEEADPHSADLAIPIGQFGVYEYDGSYRECSCGVILEGYYAYVDHLIAVLGGEPILGSSQS